MPGGADDEPAPPPAGRARPSRPSVLVARAAGLASQAKARPAGSVLQSVRARPPLETRPSVLTALEAGLASKARQGEFEGEEDEEEAPEKRGSAVRESVFEHVEGRAEEKIAEFKTRNQTIRERKALIAEFEEKKSQGSGRAAAPRDDENIEGDTDEVVAAPKDNENTEGDSDAAVDPEAEVQEAGLAGGRRGEFEHKEDDEGAPEREGSGGVRLSVMEHVEGRAKEKIAEFKTKNEAIREMKGLLAEFEEKKSESGKWAAGPRDGENNEGDTDAVVDREAEALEYITSLMGENWAVFETRGEAIRAIKGLLAESKDQEKKLTRAMVYTSLRTLYKRRSTRGSLMQPGNAEPGSHEESAPLGSPLGSIEEDADNDDSTGVDPWSAGDDEEYDKFLRFLKDGGEIG